MLFRYEGEGKSLAPKAYKHRIDDHVVEETISNLRDQAGAFSIKGSGGEQHSEIVLARQEAIRDIRAAVSDHNYAHTVCDNAHTRILTLKEYAEGADTNEIFMRMTTAVGDTPQEAVERSLEAAKVNLEDAKRDVCATNENLLTLLQQEHQFESGS